ncbi:MAG: cytosol aminopeptidase [Rhizobacter sp.]|nr:cytosol aminopeptidase [Rhizobacter sp.]
MDFRFQVASPDAWPRFAADALLVVVCGEAVDPGLDPVFAQPVSAAIADGDFSFTGPRALFLNRPAGVKATRVMIAAVGKPTALAARGFKSAIGKALADLKTTGAKHLAIALSGQDWSDDLVEAVVTAVEDALYVYRDTKPSAAKPVALEKMSLLGEKALAKPIGVSLARAKALAAGVLFAKALGNRPANHCTPTYLGEQAQALGKEWGLKVEVFDRKGIEKLGMGSLLAVAQGSAEAPRFIVARYDGAARSQAPVVLVGKGITFDTGGISIKPAGEMDEMKFDMCGAASVLGALRAVAELKPKLNLVVLIPAAENMPSGTAIKPGDVVTSMSGQTIEILNTDAEGRLVLCDALTYAERFKPSAVVDVATLTGACVVALGHHHTGLFTADEGLAGELLAAGKESLDTCWRMPLDEEYDEALKSNFADMANVGPRPGGAITAAMFLRRYTAAYRWAHLDVAGTAWKSGAAKGSTGRPVPLLTHFVLSHVPMAA